MKGINLICVMLCVTAAVMLDGFVSGLGFGAAAANALIFLDN